MTPILYTHDTLYKNIKDVDVLRKSDLRSILPRGRRVTHRIFGEGELAKAHNSRAIENQELLVRFDSDPRIEAAKYISLWDKDMQFTEHIVHKKKNKPKKIEKTLKKNKKIEKTRKLSQKKV